MSGFVSLVGAPLGDFEMLTPHARLREATSEGHHTSAASQAAEALR